MRSIHSNRNVQCVQLAYSDIDVSCFQTALFAPFTMKTFGVLLALLMITVTTEAGAYRSK